MRSHYCGHISQSLIGTQVTVSGWVHRRRDHGGVIFIDLRDREGRVQIVFNPENTVAFQTAEKCRAEYVIQVTGKVSHRPEGTVNAELATGRVEIVAETIKILNTAETPPFRIDEYQDVGEEVRLRYRYLDLRRPDMAARMKLRAKVNKTLRDYLDAQGFLEIETPFLTKSTPEGARDYLVPSRVHLGHFYALPQSPQIFKQLLMVAGMDRYYQIVRCFRDEDLRADRQPEFTQLDLELSFVDETQIQDLMEAMIRQLFQNILQVSLPNPFPKMTYAESVRRFGTDRPDLRNPLELVDVADLLMQVDFAVFKEPANNKNCRVTALCLPQGGKLSRKEIEDYTKFVSIYGAKGLAYIKVNEIEKGAAGLQSPILKFLPEAVIHEILKRVKAENGDIVFFVADKAKVVNEALGALRDKLGVDLNLYDRDAWRPVWIIDFPMFEWDEKENRWQSLHHPFTAPAVDDIAKLNQDPGNCISRAYDMVLNGSEIGGGSIRIHTQNMQQAVFKALGISPEEAEAKFSHLLSALKHGAPPHGGLAFGLDRLTAIMSGVGSIREVIAFPKTQTAQCPLTQAPSEVSEGQLRELGLKVMSQTGGHHGRS